MPYMSSSYKGDSLVPQDSFVSIVPRRSHIVKKTYDKGSALGRLTGQKVFKKNPKYAQTILSPKSLVTSGQKIRLF